MSENSTGIHSETREEQRPRYKVDTRPLWVILLVRSARYIAILVLVLLMIGIMMAETPAGLSVEGQRALGVFVLCLGLWVTHVIPLHITSLLAIMLISLFRVVETKEAYALFANEAVFFILGAFILSAIMVRCGLSSRLALLAIRKAGGSPTALRMTVFLLSAFLSFWMSEHAVAAMMFPIVMEIARSLELRPGKSAYGRALFISLGWGCVIGGIATYLGGARAPLAVGILTETINAEGGSLVRGGGIDFFRWFVAGLPLVILALVTGEVLIRIFFRHNVVDISKAQKFLEEKVRGIGRMTAREKVVGAIMLAAIFSWIYFHERVGMANTALGAVAVLFILRMVRWRDVEHSINWGIILMYGGAICLGSVMASTGAAGWVAEVLLIGRISSPIVLLISFVFISLFLTECISNTAVIALMMPMALSLAKTIGVSYEMMTFVITFPAGLAFMLPMGNPATAIIYSSGFLRTRDMIRTGLIMKLLCGAIVVLVLLIYWPFLGY